MKDEGTGLQVYKFGGASVKDAAAILNLCRIVRDFGPSGPLLIVVSAMGKTTNALEEIYDLAYHGREYSAQLAAVKAYHEQASKAISIAQPHPSIDPSQPDSGLESLFQELSYRLANLSPTKSYDEGYDHLVCFG